MSKQKRMERSQQVNVTKEKAKHCQAAWFRRWCRCVGRMMAQQWAVQGIVLDADVTAAECAAARPYGARTARLTHAYIS
jgi:hypothetical protein